MARVLRDSSQIPVRKDPSTPTNLGSLLSKQQSSKLMNVAENDILDQDSVEHVGKLEDLNKKLCVEFDGKVRHTECLRKSQSESVLCQVITEGDQVVEFSKNLNDSPNSSGSPSDEFKTNSNFEFQVLPGRDNDGSGFSVGNPTHSDMDAHEISDTPLSGDLAGDSAENTSGPSSPTLRKSRSLPNFKAPTLSSGSVCVFKHASLMSRSSDDLCALGLRNNVSYDQIRKGKECSMKKTEDFRMDRYFEDSFDSHLLSHLPKDKIIPITDGISDVEPFQGDSSVEFPNKDFKVKRIEDWVIGLQQCAPPLEDIAELPEPVDLIVDVNTGIAATPVVDHKISPGMEAAKRYISSLTANASAAQLANHGLVAIPFLSAFVSLKVLNLSGNGIGE